MEIPVVAPEPYRLIAVPVKEGESVREDPDLAVIEYV